MKKKEFYSLADLVESNAAREFIRAAREKASRIDIDRLVDLIIAGDVNRIVAITALNVNDIGMVTEEIRHAMIKAGYLEAIAIGAQFDVLSPGATNWIAKQSSKLIARIDDDTREAIKGKLSRGLAAGAGPRTTALDIAGRINRRTKRREGGVIALTDSQAGWVDNMRDELTGLSEEYFRRRLRDRRFDSVVRRAINRDEPLTRAQIEAITARYSDSLLRLRAETIARTESIEALNYGRQAALEGAIDGGLQPKHVTRIWSSSGRDGKTREDHLAMDGQEVGWGEPFTFPDGSQAMFPGDTSLEAPPEQIINCRCTFQTKIDWIQKVADDEARNSA